VSFDLLIRNLYRQRNKDFSTVTEGGSALRRRSRGRGDENKLLDMKGLEDLNDFQERKLGKIEEINLCCCQSGILELTGRTGVTSLQGVFGMDEVDGKDKSKENEKECDIEMASVFPGHRIPDN
jgi:hypothetical protein